MSDHSAETARGYLDELAVLLAREGMSADRVEVTLEELAGYLAESGGDPEEEFGQAADLARELAVTSAPPAEPAAGARTWRWTADLFHDVKMLNEYGAQGWEVDKVDAKGLFVCTRDPEHPQQWEYSRELIAPGRRQSVLDRLAPDGWEACGTWVRFEYFKRPRAASLGPAAELAAPPQAPRRGIFLSPKFYALVAADAGAGSGGPDADQHADRHVGRRFEHHPGSDLRGGRGRADSDGRVVARFPAARRRALNPYLSTGSLFA